MLHKSAFISGTTNYAFVNIPGGQASAFTLQPCTVIGPTSPGTNVAYFAETLFGDSTHVRIWALNNPLGSRTLTNTMVSVPDNGGPPPFTGAPQPGTPITIDTLDGRTQGNAFWQNGAIWFCHTAGGNSGKSLAYYYKVNLNNYPAGTPALAEEGSIDGGSGEWTYQPSIGANANGDVGIVYSQSSATRNPTIFAATRSAAAVSFDTPVLIKASPGYYFGGRWGDFASVTGDPVDNSLWVTHEWAKTTQPGAWSTWWARLSSFGGPIPDGILEVNITPADGATLLESTTEKIFVQVTDALSVTNATVVATVNNTNLNFRNDGVAPDASANDNIYTANLTVPDSTNDLTLSFLITAPGKTNSTNVVTYVVLPPPVNDYFANAIKVPVTGAFYLSNNKFATMETNEPLHAGVATVTNSLWWNWTPTGNTNVFVDTTGSAIDTVLAVYTGLAVNSLTQVVATNDVGGKKQAYLNFNATAGTAYRIAVASASSNSVGSLRFRVTPGGLPDTNPPTVAVSSPLNGQWVSNFLVTVTGTANDPQPNGSGVIRVLVSANGTLAITAAGTTNWSSTFGLRPGLNLIRVTAQDAAGNVSAPVVLQVTYVVPDPINDLFANSIPLPGSSGSSSIITTNATKEFGEPNHAGNTGGKSVWWSYQPPADGVLSLSTSNSTFDTVLALYTGASVGSLTSVAANDDAYQGAPGGFSQITQTVRSNLTYHIAVDGYGGASGTALLTYAFTPVTIYHVTVNSTAGGFVTPASADVQSNGTLIVTATPNHYFQFDSWDGAVISIYQPA